MRYSGSQRDMPILVQPLNPKRPQQARVEFELIIEFGIQVILALQACRIQELQAYGGTHQGSREKADEATPCVIDLKS